MTARRLPPPNERRVTRVARTVTGFNPSAVRAVARPVPISPRLRRAEPESGPSRRDVLRRWEELEWWACAYCDASFGPMVVAEVDHITPVAKGGVHEWSNLAPACRECNQAKSDMDMSDWIRLTAGQVDTDGDIPVTDGARDPYATRTHRLHM
ncbi:HNH endonuclease [Streptomyces sp. NPDC057557]|uniref:HNH endonuclease n=1 Tax=Streptomyces sp. NPDC057557 TaxID=3346167 RepID=UPI00368CBA7F